MTVKQPWQIDSAKLAHEILDLTRTAKTEEDVKMRVEPVFQRVFQQIGVDVDIVAYEKTTALTAKRMDAVYGYVVIEYKGPGKLTNAAGVRSVRKQLESYLSEEATRHANAEDFLEKAVGVAMDDKRILFVRYSKSARILSLPVPAEAVQGDLFPEIVPQRGFQLQGPFPVTASSLNGLLIYVRSAARRPLTAPNLATVFGPEHKVARLFVSELYAAADRYLKDNGTLAFIITQEVFKSKGAGEGFRRFKIGDEGADLKILEMEDLVQVQPFQGAANKTAPFTMRKGQPTTYPVDTVEWKRKPGVGRIAPESSLAEVMEKTTRTKMQAIPVDAKRPVSSWQTADGAELGASAKLKGENPYNARLGARVEPYGVFWLNLKEVRPDGQLVIENQHDRGKRKIDRVSSAIEPDLIYPAVSGGDIVRYGIKEPFYVLISQDPVKRAPYPEEWMLENAPLTLAYLTQFKEVLNTRGSNIVRQFAEKTEFYAMFGIGEYTFARYRVVWKRMTNRMAATVLTTWKTPFGRKTVVATDTASLITAGSAAEAHYLCAILNSETVDGYIRSFSSGGRGFGAPSVVKDLAIPPFKPRNRVHKRLAELSRQAHAAVDRGHEITDTEQDVEAAVKALWNIKP